MITTTSRRSLFAFWAGSSRYRHCGDSLGLEHSPHRIELPRLLQGCKRVLDLACGDGANLAFLPEGIDYTGCDYSAYALETLMSKTDHLSMAKRVFAGDVRQLPVETGSQDAVISSYSFEHFLEVPTILNECDRVLRPGGLLVIFGPDYTAPNAFSPPQAAIIKGNRVRLLTYTLGRLARRLRHARGRDRVLFEYVEPLVLSEATFQPDHDLTHLTNHGMIGKYMKSLGYQQIELVTTAPSPDSLLKKAFATLGLWGKFGDARVVLKKPIEPVKPRKIQVTERLVHRQPD